MQSDLLSSARLSDLPHVARLIVEAARECRVVAFYGQMGSGKTTLIQQVCLQLGVNQEVTSPTFALVYEYAGRDQHPVYHFDFYRIEDPVEALDFGLEEYLDSGNICLMEWPEMIEDLLPEERLEVRLTVNPDQTRAISLNTITG